MIAPAAAAVAKGLGIVCLLLCIGLGWQTLRVSGLSVDLEREKAGRASDRADAEAAAKNGIEAARKEERRRIAEQQEIIDEQTEALARSRADAAAAIGSADRLRQRAAQLAASCGGTGANPPATAPGAPAGAPGDLLADMLGRIDAASRGVAEFADEAGAAGTACERAYDALRPRQ